MLKLFSVHDDDSVGGAVDGHTLTGDNLNTGVIATRRLIARRPQKD